MEVIIEGKTHEFEPKSGIELYEIVVKIMDDPKYNIDYDLSFTEFPAYSDMKNFYPIEADMLLHLIESRSQKDKPITAEQCKKLLAVKKNGMNGLYAYPFVGVMVYYE